MSLLCGLFSAALRLLREPLQHFGRVGSSSLNGGRRAHHHSPLPSPQTQQAHCLRCVPQLRQVGNGAHGHHHEAQAGRRPVRGGVRRRVEEIQPDGGREDPEGRPAPRLGGQESPLLPALSERRFVACGCAEGPSQGLLLHTGPRGPWVRGVGSSVSCHLFLCTLSHSPNLSVFPHMGGLRSAVVFGVKR